MGSRQLIDQKATLGKIVTRFPSLAAAVDTHVTRGRAAVLPAGDGAIATGDQLDALLESVVTHVVAGSPAVSCRPHRTAWAGSVRV